MKANRLSTVSLLALVALCGALGCRDNTPVPGTPRSNDAQSMPVPARSTPAVVAPVVSAASVAQSPPDPKHRKGDRILFDKISSFSHMRVSDHGNERFLTFIRDNGDEVTESSMLLDAPDLLPVAYTQVMFISYLFKPEQQRCAIIGLGGGSMVRFLNRFFPEVHVDAVEIDPEVVHASNEYFGVRAGPKASIFVEDGLGFLTKPGTRYDTIYIDAFVKPAPDTDLEGMPVRLKTKRFFQDIQKRLVPGGVVVINLNDQPNLRSDVEIIRESFPYFYFFPVPRTGNYVAVGSMSELSDSQLRANGRTIDTRGNFGFSFEAMAKFRAR